MASFIPPGHGERAGPPPPMPRCPECGVVIDTTLAAGTFTRHYEMKGETPTRRFVRRYRKATREMGRCPTHGLVEATRRRREEVIDGA
jgi:hypothetical protein